MRTLLVACHLLLATLLLDVRAFSQGSPGCFQGINSTYPECPDSHGNPTRTGAICCPPGGSCAPPPGDCLFCSQGYGACPAGTTGSLTTANWAEDDNCPGCSANTCCDTGVCGYRQVCNASCNCVYASPIIVDTTGRGFHLTSANEGVEFDILGEGLKFKIAWTAANSGDAFLALDRNRNGYVDSGKELFGNMTEQPQVSDRNGFLALAEFDKPENGGNGDGIIDKRDGVFSRLLLWIDDNHDGVSQPGELHSLPELGVFSISLHYLEAQKVDQYGNLFHYRAAVNPGPRDGESKDGRWAYDVFFDVVQNQPVHNLGAQSRISRFSRREQWQSFPVEGSYRDGVLYEDLLFDPLRAAKIRCPQRFSQARPGGTK
jgi:hypothetical protein